MQGTDLRVVPAALLAWASGAVVTAGLRGSTALLLALALALVALLLAVVLALGVRGRPARTRVEAASGTVLGTVLLALLAAAAVGASGAVHLGEREAAMSVLAGADAITGRVVGDPRSGPGGTLVRLDLRTAGDGGSWAEVPDVRVLVRGDSTWADVEHGSLVGVGALPGAGRDVPLRFTALPTEAEVAELRAEGAQVLAPPAGVAAVVNRLRHGLAGATEHLSPDSRGLVPGTAVGDTRAVPRDLTQAMRDTGLAHVTAVSGAHFSVVLAALLGVGAALRWPTPLRAGATILGVLGFAVLVHPGPAVLRAAVTGGVVVLGLLLGRPSRAVPALCWAVVGLVCWDPWTSRDVGFHLSVVATAAIVLVSPALAARLAGPRALRTAVAVPLAAQAACGPLLVLLDPVVPLYAVPANMLAVPALVPGTLSGLVATVTSPWAPWLADPCIRVADIAARWLAGVARGFAALPLARVPWPAGAGGAVLLALLTAASAVVLLRRPPRVRS